MPLTKPAISVTWGGGATGSVSSPGGALSSDAFSVAVNETTGGIILVATSGATDSGYNVIFYLLASVDGTKFSTADKATARRLGALNLAAVSTEYRSQEIDVPFKLEDYKIYVENDNTGTDSVIVDVEMKVLKAT